MIHEPRGADPREARRFAPKPLHSAQGPHSALSTPSSEEFRTGSPLGFPPLRPERVLFFGKQKSRSCCTGGLVDALRVNGLKVSWVNCSRLRRWIGKWGMYQAVRLIKRLYRPDLCFVFFHDLPPLLMEELAPEIPTVVWMEEQTRCLESSHVEYVRNTRLLCLSTPSLVQDYRQKGILQSTFLMSGFSPKFHKPYKNSRGGVDRDIAFIGGPGHMGNRPEFLSRVSEWSDLTIFGLRDSWLPHMRRFKNLNLAGEARPKHYAKICARSKIILGLNQSNDSRLYFSNRFFLTLACRGFHIVRHVPGIEEVFENHRHLVWFESEEECQELCRYYLKRDAERAKIAQAGYELVTQEHQYSHRIRDILKILSAEKNLWEPPLLQGPMIPRGQSPRLVEESSEPLSLFPKLGSGR